MKELILNYDFDWIHDFTSIVPDREKYKLIFKCGTIVYMYQGLFHNALGASIVQKPGSNKPNYYYLDGIQYHDRITLEDDDSFDSNWNNWDDDSWVRFNKTKIF